MPESAARRLVAVVLQTSLLGQEIVLIASPSIHAKTLREAKSCAGEKDQRGAVLLISWL